MLSTATLFRDDGDDKVRYLMLLLSASYVIFTQRFGALKENCEISRAIFHIHSNYVNTIHFHLHIYYSYDR